MHPGKVVGTVSYFDTMDAAYFNNVTLPLQEATIQVEGTSYSTISDINGRWEIDNLPPGTYTISCTKKGYSTSKTVGFPFIGNGTDVLEFSTIARVPHLTPSSLVVRGFEPYMIRVLRDTIYILQNGDTAINYVVDSIRASGGRTTFTASLAEKYNLRLSPVMGIFFALDGNIDPEKPSTYGFYLDSQGDYSNRFNFTFTTDTLRAHGFKSGQEIYCAAFATNLWGKYCGYYDIETGRRALSGYRSDKVVNKFIMP